MSSIPSGWKACQVGDYLNIGRGFAFKSHDYRLSGLPIVRVTNITDNGDIDLTNNVVFLDQNEITKYSNFILRPDDVLIVMVGATVGKLAKIRQNIEVAVLNQNMWRLVVLDKKSDFQKYTYYAIQPVVDKFLSSQQGSARDFLTQAGFSLADIVLPPLPEQQKIANILTSVDDVIESTQAQINKLKDLKTGMMQELLTKGIGHAEFKDSPVGKIPKVWESFTIGELLSSSVIEAIQDGNHGEKHPKSSDFVSRGIPFIMASDIKDGEIIISSANKISEEVYRGLRIGFSKAGDVLLTHKATVGLTAIVPDHVDRLMLTPQVTYYRIGMPEKLLKTYLYYYFQSNTFQDAISILSAQSTRSYIGIKAQQEMLIAIPDTLDEQIKITNILSSMDKKIVTTNEKLACFTKFKKALMQDLLTGKVRVKI